MPELHAGRDKLHKELDRLLELLAVEHRLVESHARKSEPVILAEPQAPRQRLVESQARKLAPILQGDMAEARFVLAAQQRIKSVTPNDSGAGVTPAE
jgi:hypothetical protein